MWAALAMLLVTLVALVFSARALVDHVRSERAYRRDRDDAIRRLWAALTAGGTDE